MTKAVKETYLMCDPISYSYAEDGSGVYIYDVLMSGEAIVYYGSLFNKDYRNVHCVMVESSQEGDYFRCENQRFYLHDFAKWEGNRKEGVL